ncbi:unnamed protein product, partial [Laminaria digitata]
GEITERPAWLTRDMLGKTTLSDSNNGYLTNGSKLCARYDEAGRTIRRDMATFLDRNAPQQKLKSGTQASDFMNNLNNHMWNLSNEGKRRAAEAVASSGEIDPTADPVPSSASSPGNEGEAPEHWIHVNLLTFALFGPFSFQNDSDLSLSSSDGPSRKTSPAAGSPETDESSGGSASPEPGIESPNCIKLLAASDAKTSRRGIKKAMEANRAAVKIEAESGTKRKVEDILERQQHQSGDMALAMREWRESLKKKELLNQAKARRKKHTDHVRSIRHANRQKVKVHDREIKHLERRLALARDNDDDEERRLVYKELKEALKTKVQLEEVPGPLAEGGETALSAEAAATTGATPGPTPMTARPPPTGTCQAPNAQVPKNTNEAAVATTSWEGIAGSAVPMQHPPLGGGSQVLLGASAPSPAPAARSSIAVDTTSREGVAGSAVSPQHPPSRETNQLPWDWAPTPLPPGWTPTPPPAPAAPASATVFTTSRERIAGSAVPMQHPPLEGGSQVLLGASAPSPAPAARSSIAVDT